MQKSDSRSIKANHKGKEQKEGKGSFKKDGWNISVHNKKLRIYLAGKEVFISSLELSLLIFIGEDFI